MFIFSAISRCSLADGGAHAPVSNYDAASAPDGYGAPQDGLSQYGDSCSKVCGFESGTVYWMDIFSHKFAVKFIMFV